MWLQFFFVTLFVEAVDELLQKKKQKNVFKKNFLLLKLTKTEVHWSVEALWVKFFVVQAFIEAVDELLQKKKQKNIYF